MRLRPRGGLHSIYSQVINNIPFLIYMIWKTLSEVRFTFYRDSTQGSIYRDSTNYNVTKLERAAATTRPLVYSSGSTVAGRRRSYFGERARIHPHDTSFKCTDKRKISNSDGRMSAESRDLRDRC